MNAGSWWSMNGDSHEHSWNICGDLKTYDPLKSAPVKLTAAMRDLGRSRVHTFGGQLPLVQISLMHTFSMHNSFDITSSA
ncbi:unnamed protein product [Peronospora belbahrii]|uniref:Uncharacterized protein n=1 Tax=Peronospora belbahrii TaxID=622444 RepID=A0ABN8D7I5_9STRA|nr:unnamed protein product [Peronospora belbahrii]